MQVFCKLSDLFAFVLCLCWDQELQHGTTNLRPPLALAQAFITTRPERARPHLRDLPAPERKVKIDKFQLN